ncbi:pirin [Paenibacillaceae bacterium]|nr:pirin [Paenibacillaceae bacterium]
MQPMVYTPAMQATGAFDNGKIIEQKPIGFPGEGSAVKRLGPLFYWAWATANADAHIGLHPHQGFEIMSYVTEGEGVHGDTLGTVSKIGPGGAQVMQTGSGVSHEERLGQHAELFQIWFEPDLVQAVKRAPTYNQYEHEQFPLVQTEGYQAKTVIGEGAPIKLTAEVRMWDVQIQPGGSYVHTLQQGYILAALAIRGQGFWTESDEHAHKVSYQHKDFIVGRADTNTEIVLSAHEGESTRLLLIEVPEQVDYPLYRKR